ncbi:MAG: tRNA pseudouridine(13) synthase TruD [Planctomycetes bacterium]|nr:tRNA pseudouridine(13) synthase TruD [Planctomycetota bacterium]
MAIKPTRPVPRGGPAPRRPGRYKTVPEDFVVEELPAYQPCGSGDHTWLWVEKRGLSTMDLLRELAQELRRDERSFGIAGLKDAQAISRQWVSIDGVDSSACARLAQDRWSVLAVSRHGNKLRMGHLRGNRFVVTLRGTGPDAARDFAANLQDLAVRGVPNYFGEQRFGKRGANLQKGLEVLRGNARAIAQRMPRRVFGLLISAVQSEVFNKVVIARLAALGELWAGDLAYLHRNGAVFAVADPAAEAARLAAVEVSPSGPLPGPEMLAPSGAMLALEEAALAEVGVSVADFGRLPFRLGRGERRPLRVPVREVAVAEVAAGVQVAFALPSGAYATSVLRELLDEAIWFGPGE